MKLGTVGDRVRARVPERTLVPESCFSWVLHGRWRLTHLREALCAPLLTGRQGPRGSVPHGALCKAPRTAPTRGKHCRLSLSGDGFLPS